MNELTKQLQEIMVPKAALIAYEYQEGHYASGSHYLELRPINKKGRMEAGIPVTYEFMDSLVESYSDGNRRIPHGWLPPNMLWCDTRRGHESYVWYNPPGKRRMFFMNDLNIGDGMFHVPGVIYIIKNERMDIFAYKGKKPDGRTPLYLAPFFNVTGGSVCLGTPHWRNRRAWIFTPCWNIGRNVSGSVNFPILEEGRTRRETIWSWLLSGCVNSRSTTTNSNRSTND